MMFSRRTWRWIVITASILILLLGTLGAVATWLFYSTPPAWRQKQAVLAAANPADVEAAARSVETRLTRALTDVGPAERTINFREATLNAWLRERLRPWAAQQDIDVPAELGQVVLDINPDSVRVLAELISEDDTRRVVSLDFKVDVPETGKGYIKIAGVQAGRLPLPVSLFNRDPETSDDDNGLRITEYIRGVTFDAGGPIDETREVALVDARLVDGEITLVFEVKNRD